MAACVHEGRPFGFLNVRNGCVFGYSRSEVAGLQGKMVFRRALCMCVGSLGIS